MGGIDLSSLLYSPSRTEVSSRDMEGSSLCLRLNSSNFVFGQTRVTNLPHSFFLASFFAALSAFMAAWRAALSFSASTSTAQELPGGGGATFDVLGVASTDTPFPTGTSLAPLGAREGVGVVPLAPLGARGVPGTWVEVLVEIGGDGIADDQLFGGALVERDRTVRLFILESSMLKLIRKKVKK